MSSAYPILLWWSWECVLYLIIIIKPEVWIINHCLGLGHETMVCAVCLTMFLRNRDIFCLMILCVDYRHLTHCCLVTPYSVIKLGHHWFMQQLVARSTPSRELNRSWFIINCTFRKFQLEFNLSLKKMHVIMSSQKWRPFCSGPIVLI